MKIQRPGFGLPLKLSELLETFDPGERDRFPHAIEDFFAVPAVTLREQRMLEFIGQITDKPRWWEKIKNDEIVARWRKEACGTKQQQQRSSDHLDQKSFDYCLAELHDKAAYLQQYGVVHVLDVKITVVKSDLDLADVFWTSLKSAVLALENVPDRCKDWHPHTNKQVLDLLHPSLFPLEFGKTRVLSDSLVPLEGCVKYTNKGKICQVPREVKEKAKVHMHLMWNNVKFMQPWGSFQWLPSEIEFHQNGRAYIASYVNNLHPDQHKDTYRVLETAVDKAVPLWNECLSWFHSRSRIEDRAIGVEDLVPPAGSNGETDDDVDWEDPDYDTWVLKQQPSADTFVPFDERAQQAKAQRLDVRTRFSEGLQVIFKLANIVLTPENPRYDGSNWHIEGCLNEHIAATALLYYDSDNVTDSQLHCRQHVDAEEMRDQCPQGEGIIMCKMYGVNLGGSAVQELGKVLTKPGRILAFPNVLQHKVGPFQLQDKSKPGHRKILAMFLVDPHIQVLSTANVPPQRRDWWAAEIRKVELFARLPVELFDHIIDDVEDFPMTWKQACDAREELMKERGAFTAEFDEILNEDVFDFCEH